jgi:hypothetical protein
MPAWPSISLLTGHRGVRRRCLAGLRTTSHQLRRAAAALNDDIPDAEPHEAAKETLNRE